MNNLFKFDKNSKIIFFIFTIFSTFSFFQIVLIPNLFNLKKILLKENKELIYKLIKFKKSNCKRIYAKKNIYIEENSLIYLICKIDFDE